MAQDRWFSIIGEKSFGPFSEEELISRFQSGELSPAHYVWKDGLNDWVRLVDIQGFQSYFPPKPDKNLIEALRAPAAPPEVPAPRDWYLYLNGSQEGPYHQGEVVSFYQTGKVDSQTFVWKVGMDNWQALAQTPELASSLPSQKPAVPPPPAGMAQGSQSAAPAPAQSSSQSTPAAATSAENSRSAPRIPITARVLFHDNQLVGEGLCRDLSIGGAQILLDARANPNIQVVPVGSVIKMNLHSEEAVSDGKKVVFTTEAVVVRHLSSGERGFAVRFLNIEDEFINLIQNYVGKDS